VGLTTPPPAPGAPALARFAWLSILAAVVTITMKAAAWWLTGSVGLLSDALESVVNLAAAVMTLGMLGLAARPPDDEHAHGYSKAEYFASGVEGALILLAAAAIAASAVPRLGAPPPVERAGVGLAVSAAASLVNLGVARVLLRAGRRHGSIALEADGHHLMTDVWTSVGVIAAVGAVAGTGWRILDPLVALAVAANIVWTGVRIVRRSALGLLDRSLDPADLSRLREVLGRHEAAGVVFHAVRTRQAGTRRFVTFHVLVPGSWTVARGHDLVERIEGEVRAAIPAAHVLTHLEPVEDPASFDDVGLDRER
jgi:cation diffusion facilitator family transporter